MTEEVRMGIYRHYKGHLYQVIGLAHDANIDGRTCVVYIGLELDAAHLGPRFAVREVGDFLAELRSGGKRFEYLGPEMTPEIAEEVRLRKRDELERYAQTVISMRQAKLGPQSEYSD